MSKLTTRLPQPQLKGWQFCHQCEGVTYIGRIGVDERRCPTCNGAGLTKEPTK